MWGTIKCTSICMIGEKIKRKDRRRENRRGEDRNKQKNYQKNNDCNILNLMENINISKRSMNSKLDKYKEIHTKTHHSKNVEKQR